MSKSRLIKDILTQYSVNENGCWLWSKYCSSSTAGHYGGYGIVRHGGKLIKAHRLSYEFHIGIIPQGKWVLHRCDTPQCINPDHLFIGTNQENQDDMYLKGRGKKSFGENHILSSLSDNLIRDIRWIYNNKMTINGIKKLFSIKSRSTIPRIVRFETRKRIISNV